MNARLQRHQAPVSSHRPAASSPAVPPWSPPQPCRRLPRAPKPRPRPPVVCQILFQRLDDGPVGCEQGSAMSLVLALWSALRASLRTRTDLALENLALPRQQLVLLRRPSKATAIGASMDEKIRFRKRSLRPARQGSSGPFSFLSTASLGARTDAFLQANGGDPALFCLPPACSTLR